MKYRLGLDLGTNSLGWAVHEIDADKQPFRLERMGARIYGDGRNPKDGSSKAVERRGPRQMRRRRDRYLRRRGRYIDALVRAGLFPENIVERQKLLSLNPYRLRAEGLERELTPFELGRALFHLQQRRGFMSNRKTDKQAKDADKDPGKIKSAIERFDAELAGTTVGATLWKRIQNGKPVRARLLGSGATAGFDFYISRAMVEHEFDALWEAQERLAPGRFSRASRQELLDILLFQRELLPQDVGRCYLERQEPRAAVALPSSQRFRLYQEVNNLRLFNKKSFDKRPLTRPERDTLIDALQREAERTLPRLREILFGRAEAREWLFTLEDEKRSKLRGDQTSAKLSSAEAFGDAWSDFSLDEQDKIVAKLIEEPNERLLVEWLTGQYGLTEPQAEHISGLSLPADYFRLSTKAMNRILPHLVDGWDVNLDQPLTYDKAALAAGYNHSDQRTGELLFKLPYYGEVLSQYTMPAGKSKVAVEREFGKIGNPTVHIGLNQLRKVVNTLIETYGLPEQIVVEVARELSKSPDEKREIERKQKQYQEENEALRRELERLGQPDTFDNRLRLRLYNELGTDKFCVYSGRKVGLSSLFTNEYQVDHILPISVTLDDGYANKVLVHQGANKYKGKRSPYEAFGASVDGYSWPDILTRAEALPKNKQQRFSPEAMEEDGHRKDFLARQLTDTQYLARVARQYLESICADVWVTPGRLTGLLRGKWGLNSILSASGKKERTDHRHHAIDAVVIGVTDRSLLQRVSTAAGRAEDIDSDSTFGEGFPEPWPTFREEIVAAVQRVVVSHKPDHGTGSALHNETAYGIVSGPDEREQYRVRHKISIESVREKHLKDLQVDAVFREELEEAILRGSGEAEIVKNLADLRERRKRRAVRYVETLSVIPVYRKGETAWEGAEPYKAYKGDSNYCYEIFRMEDGKWGGRVVSSFEAQSNEYRSFMESPGFRTTAWSGEPLVMRVMRDDMIAIEETEGVRRVMRLQKLSPGQLALAEHYEANVDARTRDKDDLYRMAYKTPGSLKKERARRVFVDPIGRVKDPGFRE